MPTDMTTEARIPETGRRPRATPGASLEVEYRDDAATLRLMPDPDDVDASARLLCAAVQHVRRRRHARRVHTAVDTAGPAGGLLLAALRSRVGIDVDEIVLRRAGSTVMVTAELLPVGGGPAVGRPTPARGRLGERPRGRDSRPASHPRPRAGVGTRT
jgi:hypothetical protein